MAPGLGWYAWWSGDPPRGALGETNRAAGGDDEVPRVHDPEHEYGTVGENIRHIQNIHFRHMTVFITVTAGLASVALGIAKTTPPDIARPFINFFGLLFTGASWLNADIYLDRSARLQARAVELEKQLGYHQYSTMPQHRIKLFRVRRLRPGTLSWYLLFLSVAVFWVGMAFRWLK